MFEKKHDFSRADLADLLRQPETRALLERLKQMDPAALQNAVNLAFRGNTEGAKDALSPLLSDPEVQRLSGQLRENHGGV